MSGVFAAGFTTIVFPVARQGATLCATRFRGKLNGVIALITPIGKRRENPVCPAPAGIASSGSTSPAPLQRRASSAAVANVQTARATSPSASVIGFPLSATIISANSSRRISIACAMRASSDARSCAGTPRVREKAACAAAIAESIACASPSDTRAISSPVKGFRTGSVAAVPIHFPPMKSRVCMAYFSNTSRFSTKIFSPSFEKLSISASGASASGIITPRSGIAPSTMSRAASAGGMPVCTTVSE